MAVESESRFLYRIVQASSGSSTKSRIETTTSTATVSAQQATAISSSGDHGDNSTAVGTPLKSQNPDTQDLSPKNNSDTIIDQLNVVSSSSDTTVDEEGPLPTKKPKLDSPLAQPSTSNDTDHEIKGVIFDMHGTLTLPLLNLAEIRRELNIAPEADIIPTVLKMPPEEKERSLKIIEEFEVEGAKKLKLQPGALDLLHYIAENGVKRAFITRSSNVQIEAFFNRLKEEISANQKKYPSLSKDSIFSQVLTRDFQPVKPDPAAVFHICECWSIDPRHTVIVGDDKTDMMCGERAGVGVRILLKNDSNKGHEEYSDFAVDSLSDVISLLSGPVTVTRKN